MKAINQSFETRDNIKENSILLLIELLYFSRFKLKMVLLDVQEIFLYYLSG